MAQLTDRPFPPGTYPVVIIGTGPGGLQMAADLRRLGVDHALLSSDEAPGGMFRRFPFFQRLITWTKPFAPCPRHTRAYEWYDWNSLIAEDERMRALVAEQMDGISYFPSREEMERGLVAFAEQVGIEARYGCSWRATRTDDDGFIVETDDGEYRCRVLVVAVGMTQPWKPDIDGMDEVPHYVETRPAREYADRKIFIVGKRNSGFELADGLLPWARQIIVGSPRPARISVVVRSTAAARARYLQPYEDHVLGGGHVVLDAAIERIERHADGYRVVAGGTTRPGEMIFDVDEVIAATGFTTPLLDLPELGVRTFYQGRLPVQSPYWESTVPGLFFAGSITQGSIGLKKYGVPSNSAAVHGFRYNARVLAEHIATTRFGIEVPRRRIAPDKLVPLLLDVATDGPELWNQQAYLARVIEIGEKGATDRGTVPLAHFVDHAGPDAIAITVETDTDGDIHPAVYLRRAGTVHEHLLPSHPMLDFRTDAHHRELSAVLEGVIAR